MHSDIRSDMGEVFFALCKAVNTPVSLGCWLRYKYSHTELASMDIHPRDYTSSTHFKNDYMCVSFLSKYKGLNTGIDLEAVALQKFKQSEDQCEETNARFRGKQSTVTPLLGRVFHLAQRKIADLLGPLNEFQLTHRCGFGPGATFELPRRRAQVDRKLTELPITVSRTAFPYFRAVLAQDLHWSQAILGVMPEGNFSFMPNVFIFQDECRVETVPKNAKTHRIIAIEPRGNGFLQKGVGGFLRIKLRRVGVDLDNQARNQYLASQAHLLNLATLDLRAASDTVSKELVYQLLPYDWAAYLDAIRSRLAVMPDKSSIVLKKFSSMGNGFTFELESLIFWALCSSVTDLLAQNGIVAVYGDDLIVVRDIAEEVIAVLNYCGFSVNDQKSFIDGQFFESCGKHYFSGEEVTPAYQKELVTDNITAIRCGNRLIRLSFRLNGRKSLSSALRPAWTALRRQFPISWKWAIPFGTEGDDAWLLPYSEFPFSKRHFGSDSSGRSFGSGMGLRCRVLSYANLKVPADDKALLAVWMRESKDRLRDPTIYDELPSPREGSLEIVPQVPTWVSSNRWVIPTGMFSVNWR